MATTFYRVGDDTNFAVTHWVFEAGDPFGFIHQLYPGHLVVTPIGVENLGFPPPPRSPPICTVKTFGPDGVTPTPDAPPSDFKSKGDYWIISHRLKHLLEAVDPGAFSFVEIEMQWARWRKGRTAWLARVSRSFETHDPADIPDGAHAFLRSKNHGLSFFDEELRQRILTEGISGLRFRAVSKF